MDKWRTDGNRMLQCKPCCIYQRLNLYYYYEYYYVYYVFHYEELQWSRHMHHTRYSRETWTKTKNMIIIVYQWYLLICRMFPPSLVACATFRLIALHEKSRYSTVQTSPFFWFLLSCQVHIGGRFHCSLPAICNNRFSIPSILSVCHEWTWKDTHNLLEKA